MKTKPKAKDNVPERKARALANGHKFSTIKNLDEVLISGTKDFDGNFDFRVVPPAEYEAFLATFHP